MPLDPTFIPASADATQAALDAKADQTDFLLYDENRPLDLPTPYPTLSATHPTVYDSMTESGNPTWNGYRYWMAYTPWPPGNIETPCILCSNDLVTWSVPVGLTNPIATHHTVNAALGTAYGYLADPDFVMDAAGYLRCYYKAHRDSPTQEAVVMQKSLDGITWTTPVNIINHTDSVKRLVSPAVIRDGSSWTMWVVDRHTGATAEHLRVKRLTSSDGLTWSSASDCTLPTGAFMAPWHLDVNYVNGVYHMLLLSDADIILPTALLYFYSADGITWEGSADYQAIDPSGGAYDAVRFYRSCMIPADSVGSSWHVFVSGLPLGYIDDGFGGINPWRIGLRKNLTLRDRVKLRINNSGISAVSLNVDWSSNKNMPAGESVDICKPSTYFSESCATMQGTAEIYGMTGSAGTVIGGIWTIGTFGGTLVTTALASTTGCSGNVTPFIQLSGLPDNVTPTSGMAVVGLTSGATAVFHRIRNSSPAQYSLRSFSGTAQFAAAEQISVNGTTAQLSGVPVTISSINYFPKPSAINLLMIDSISGYPGRLQVYNSYSTSSRARVKVQSFR